MKNPLARLAIAPEPDLPPLAENPEIVALDARTRALECRLAQTRLRRERARRPANAAATARPALERAELLARGGLIPSAPPASEIDAADQEELILRRGLIALATEREEVVSRLNYAMSQSFRERHVASLRRLDGALGDAHAALKDLHDIAHELAAAGYAPSVTVLPANVPPALYRLGDPADSRGEAWRFRQWLIKTFGER
jgi:hypothetical protein